MSASYPEAAALFKPIPRAILFDAGFTLVFHDGARLAAYAAKGGVTADAAALEGAERALRAELREPDALDRAASVILREHRASNAWRRVGVGVRASLERLREAGFKLAVVSNSE